MLNGRGRARTWPVHVLRILRSDSHIGYLITAMSLAASRLTRWPEREGAMTAELVADVHFRENSLKILIQ